MILQRLLFSWFLMIICELRELECQLMEDILRFKLRRKKSDHCQVPERYPLPTNVRTEHTAWDSSS